MNKLFSIILFLLIKSLNIFGKESKYIDLTYGFNKDIPLYPGRYSTFNVEHEGYTPNGFWLASKGFCISEHTSTHIDAPYHVNKDGWKLDEIPIENLLDVKGVMIDIYDKIYKFENGKLNVIKNYALTKQDILDWEKVNGEIPDNSVVLLRTGWSNRWNSRKFYFGRDSDEIIEEDSKEKYKKPSMSDITIKVNYPGFGESSAKFLANERKVLGAGIDCISLDTGISQAIPMHVIFLGKNKYLLENVANLHLLPPKGFKLFVVPFKIDHGTGAPTRILAKLD